MKRLILSALLGLALSGPALAATYAIDSNHTQVHFTYSHFGYSNLSGRLTEVTGNFDFDPADPAKSSIDVSLPMASLSTGVAKLDAHLASPDFFDAEKFPTASFKSTGVTVTGKNKLDVAGNLTLHGVTRPVVLNVTINSLEPKRGSPAAGFDAVATIKRSEFGVSRMVPAVPDEVKLSITLEAQQPKPEAAAAN
jgi:polyisoprenoid-binding protein YceI